jgi:hypothetical protein
MTESEFVYLKPKEAAAHLRTSISTLAKMRVYGGGPPFYRIGTAIRYSLADLDEWIAETRVRSTSEPVGTGAPLATLSCRPARAESHTRVGPVGSRGQVSPGSSRRALVD